MFKTILCVLVFCIIALVVYGWVNQGVNYSVDKICNDYAKNNLQCIEDTR